MDDAALDAALARPARTIDDVISTMEAIGAALPRSDGVARFNQLYLAMTRSVGAAVSGARFEDPVFMKRFDAVFAEEYFGALRRHRAEPGSASRPWRALLDARSRRHVHPLGFAICGMNAHINYDLARALAKTTAELGGELALDSARHRDFLAINRVLAETEAGVKSAFVEGVLKELDNAFGAADDRAALWSIFRARDAAWTNAMLLWTTRDTLLAGAFDASLGRTIGLLGKAFVL